jgi:ornithine carbamoyltransferase
LQLAKVPGAGSFSITNSRDEAMTDVDIVYCDSWMSYHIPNDEKAERLKMLMPYQVMTKPKPLTPNPKP